MKSIVLLTACVFAAVGSAYAQFGLNLDECTTGRLLDPFLMQALKSKYPKKYSAKLEYAKDLALDAKYKLQVAKLLARHMKNLNSANYDLQNLMYQAQQPGMVNPMALSDQSALMAQQQQQQQQQQQLASFQIPIDVSRSLTITPQTDSCYPQMADPRYQQATLQLAGAQRYENPVDAGCSPCSKPECPCSCEEKCSNDPLPHALTSVLSTFVGVLKNILN